MMAGVVAAAARPLSPVVAVLWTPLNMATVPQIYLDAQDSVVTDVGGACSAISNLGAMGASGNFSQATAGRRPEILAAELNGKRVLRFDGTDDVLLGDTTQQKDLLRNVGAGWSFEVIKKRTTDASGAASRIVFDCRNGATSVRFGTLAGTATAGEQNRPRIQVIRLDGGTSGALTAGVASTAYSMRLFHINYATGRGDIYVDGVLVGGSPTLVDAGSTSNTPSIAPLSIGAFNTGIIATDMDMASMVIDRIALSAGDIDRLFGWAAHKYGLTTNLPGGHPYKTVAPTA